MAVIPRVVDLSHYNRIAPDGFKQAAAAGIWGVINKATESIGYIDDTYANNRKLVKDAGLLWGAYHFVRPGSMARQVDHFLLHAAPDDQTMLALDWEVDGVSPDEASEFLRLVAQKTGRKPILYSGHTAKDKLGSRIDPFLGSHNLWLAQYANIWSVQRSWKAPWLWQYSGDKLGPLPHGVPGIFIGTQNYCDMNHYPGTREQLTAEWIGEAIIAPPPPVDPSIVVANLENIKRLQEALNTLPTTEPDLVVDGDLGNKTFTAIMRALKV